MFIGIMGVTISCMEEVDSPLNVSEANTVSFIIEDFIPEGQTKSAAQITDSGIKFQWSENDIIGIFPQEGWQTEFAIESGAGSNVAVFDGGSWGLKNDATYYAYYPFSTDNFESKDKRERVRYSYEGQEACFADDNGVVDLSKYDFMASGASTVENGHVNFNFKHLGALCRIIFEAPATATYSHVIIEAEDAVFSLSGYYDASDKDADGAITLIPDLERKSQFDIHFPANNNSFEAFEKVELYFLMPPVDLTDQALKFKLLDTEFNYYDADMLSKNIEVGGSYGWDVDIDIYHAPLGMETANCYVISKAGSYSFPTVKGNGTAYVGDVASAEVLWESFGTDVAPAVGALVSEVSYSDGQISYTASNLKGNASIAAKDADGNILWSWHIWLTDKPAEQVYNNNAGTMMDRNLGATSATPGDVKSLGLLYQWGRKDPFLGGSSIISGRLQAASTLGSWPSPVSSNSSIGTISYAIEHPTTFIMPHDRITTDDPAENGDWLYPISTSIDNTRWQSSKTIYDPCPAGYRVPDGGSSGVWKKAFGDYYVNYPSFDFSNKGYNFGKSETTKSLTAETTCWYPASGCLDGYDGSLCGVGFDGYYWYCTPDGYFAYSLYFDSSGDVDPSYDSNRANGLSVRCLRE